MIDFLEENWRRFLNDETESEYFHELQKNVDSEYDEQNVYPPENEIFNAFNFCSLDDIKVVLIGQDPYHGKGQANGLCFSVKQDQKLPPSLKNIFKELKDDIGIQPEHGDLSHWANQGVLMLNTVLTVREGDANSHIKLGWKTFTKAVIKKIAEEKKNIVFMLWGGQAQTFDRLIDSDKHKVLKWGHPSPLSANRGYWFGNKHFSQTNAFLRKTGREPINW